MKKPKKKKLIKEQKRIEFMTSTSLGSPQLIEPNFVDVACVGTTKRHEE